MNKDEVREFLLNFLSYVGDQLTIINDNDLSKVPLWTFFVFLFSLLWVKMIINFLKVFIKIVIYGTIAVIIFRIITGLSTKKNQTHLFRIGDLWRTILDFFRQLGLSF